MHLSTYRHTYTYTRTRNHKIPNIRIRKLPLTMFAIGDDSPLNDEVIYSFMILSMLHFQVMMVIIRRKYTLKIGKIFYKD